MTIKLEVGKTYETRDGDTVTIEAETNHIGTYCMQGTDAMGRITWRSRRGRFTRHPHRMDLVAEVTKRS